MNYMVKITESAYPALFQAADKASIYSQKKNFAYLRAYITMLIGAVFFSYQLSESIIGNICALLLFMLSLFILIVLQLTKPSEATYMTRSLAESVKTLSWKWMMHTKPYQKENHEKEFLHNLNILVEMSNYNKTFVKSETNLDKTISKEMKEIRNMSFENRKQSYLEQRIKEQYKWYVSKSNYNKRMGELWFWCSVVLNIAAIVIILFRMENIYYPLHLGIVVSSTTAVLTWYQSKRFNELSIAYNQTAYEIGLIISEANSITTEEALSSYVQNSENAISREHTNWYARKV